MAAKKTAKTKASTPKESPKKDTQAKKNLGHHVKTHLSREVKLSLGTVLAVIIVIAVLFLIKLPYQAHETYTEIVPKEKVTLETVPDLEKPIEIRVCEEMPAETEVTNHRAYGRPYGKEFRCYSEFRVWNKDNIEGEWTYSYTFLISGKEVAMEQQTKNIVAYGTNWFYFETDDCLDTDTVDGEYEFISGPSAEICKYETSYEDKTIEIVEIVEEEVQKERIITKYESLWQRIFGYNKEEKV